MKSNNYTSSLPSELLKMLDLYAKKFSIPKNRIIEHALRAYFEKLKKAEYTHSFRNANADSDVRNMAEDGLSDYLKILDSE